MSVLSKLWSLEIQNPANPLHKGRLPGVLLFNNLFAPIAEKNAVLSPRSVCYCSIFQSVTPCHESQAHGTGQPLRRESMRPDAPVSARSALFEPSSPFMGKSGMTLAD